MIGIESTHAECIQSPTQRLKCQYECRDEAIMSVSFRLYIVKAPGIPHAIFRVVVRVTPLPTSAIVTERFHLDVLAICCFLCSPLLSHSP